MSQNMARTDSVPDVTTSSYGGETEELGTLISTAIEPKYTQVIDDLNYKRSLAQEKTFIKWINYKLKGTSLSISNLYDDLQDGVILIKLLEILSGRALRAPSECKSRIFYIENNLIALKFLEEEYHLQVDNIGPPDIVDGNKTLILGLIWMIIIHFELKNSLEEATNQSPCHSSIGNTLKNDRLCLHSLSKSLLMWCQIKTAGYKNIDVKDFCESWRNGLGFCALIDFFMPNLINYEILEPEKSYYNLQLAFNLAHDQLGIEKLLDPEDVIDGSCDERAIFTYLASLYSALNRLYGKKIIKSRLQNFTNDILKFNENNKLIKQDFDALFSILSSDLSSQGCCSLDLQTLNCRVQNFFHSILILKALKCKLSKNTAMLDTHKISLIISISTKDVNSLFQLIGQYVERYDEINDKSSSKNEQKLLDNNEFDFISNKIEIIENSFNDIEKMLLSTKLPHLIDPLQGDYSLDVFQILNMYLSAYKFIPFEFNNLYEQIESLEIELSQYDVEESEGNHSECLSQINMLSSRLESLKDRHSDLTNLFDNRFKRFNSLYPLIQSCFKLEYMIQDINNSKFELPQIRSDMALLLENINLSTTNPITCDDLMNQLLFIRTKVEHWYEEKRSVDEQITEISDEIWHNPDCSSFIEFLASKRDSVGALLTLSLDQICETELNIKDIMQKQVLQSTILRHLNFTEKLHINLSSILTPEDHKSGNSIKNNKKVLQLRKGPSKIYNAHFGLADLYRNVHNALNNLCNESSMDRDETIITLDKISKQLTCVYNIVENNKLKTTNKIDLENNLNMIQNFVSQVEKIRNTDISKITYSELNLHYTKLKDIFENSEIFYSSFDEIKAKLDVASGIINNFKYKLDFKESSKEITSISSIVECAINPLEMFASQIRNCLHSNTHSENIEAIEINMNEIKILKNQLGTMNNLIGGYEGETTTSTVTNGLCNCANISGDHSSSTSNSNCEHHNSLKKSLCSLKTKLNVLDRQVETINTECNLKYNLVNAISTIQKDKKSLESFNEYIVQKETDVQTKQSCSYMNANLNRFKNSLTCLDCVTSSASPEITQGKLQNLCTKVLEEKRRYSKEIEKCDLKVKNLEKTVKYRDILNEKLSYLDPIIHNLLAIAGELSIAIETHSDMINCDIETIEIKYITMMKIIDDIHDKIAEYDYKICKISDNSTELSDINRGDSIFALYNQYFTKISHASLMCKNLELQLKNLEEELDSIKTIIDVHQEVKRTETSSESKQKMVYPTTSHCFPVCLKSELSTRYSLVDHEKIRSSIDDFRQQKKSFKTIRINQKNWGEQLNQQFEEHCEIENNQLTESSSRTTNSNISQTNRINTDLEKEIKTYQNYIDFYYVKDYVDFKRYSEVSNESLALKLQEIKTKYEQLADTNNTASGNSIDDQIKYCSSRLTEIVNEAKKTSVAEVEITDTDTQEPRMCPPAIHIVLQDRLELLLSYNFDVIFTEFCHYNEASLLRSIKKEYISDMESQIQKFRVYNNQKQIDLHSSLKTEMDKLIIDCTEHFEVLDSSISEKLENVNSAVYKLKLSQHVNRFEERLIRIKHLENSINLSQHTTDLSITWILDAICNYGELDSDIRAHLINNDLISSVQSLINSQVSIDEELHPIGHNLSCILEECSRKLTTVMASPNLHILPGVLSSFDIVEPVFRSLCTRIDSLVSMVPKSHINTEKTQLILNQIHENQGEFRNLIEHIEEAKSHHEKLLFCGNKVNSLNWFLKIRKDVVYALDIDCSYNTRNSVIVDCLEKLSSDVSEQEAKILSEPVKLMQSEINNTNLFQGTVSNWLKDCQESWDVFFDLINSQKRRFESNKLISVCICNGQYVLSEINIIDKVMQSVIDSSNKADVRNYPDFRLDVANLTSEVQKCVDESRLVNTKPNISSTSLGIDLNNVIHMLVSRFNDLYDKSVTFNSLIMMDTEWLTFKTLDRKLRSLLTDIMQRISATTFEKSNDGEIWTAMMKHKALEEEANSLFSMFNALQNLANNMIFDDPSLYSQTEQLVLSVTSKRADLMQMIENLCAELRYSLYESIKSHDSEIKHLAKKMTESEIEYLSSLLKDLDSRSDLVAIKYLIENLGDFVRSSQQHLDSIEIDQDFSNDCKNVKIEPQDIRSKYIVDFSKLHNSQNWSHVSTMKQRNLPYSGMKKLTDHDENTLYVGNDSRHYSTLTKKSLEFTYTNIDQLEGKLFHRIVYLKPTSAKKLVLKKRWENLYCILSFGMMFLYKAQEDIQKFPNRPMYTWDLFDCSISIVGSHRGKENVFCIKQNNDEFEIILCARSADESITWVNMISKQSTQKTNSQFNRISSAGMRQVKKRSQRLSKAI